MKQSASSAAATLVARQAFFQLAQFARHTGDYLSRMESPPAAHRLGIRSRSLVTGEFPLVPRCAGTRRLLGVHCR